jgi:hypothetical protein
MKKKANNVIVWLMALGFLAGFILLLWALYKLPFVTLPLLIIFPIWSYHLYKKGHRSQNISYVLILAMITVFFSLMNIEKQINFYAQPFVDGRVVEKEYISESSEGEEFIATKRIYIPNTTKGKNVLSVIRYGIVVVSILSVVLAGWFFKIADERKKE